jgi:hypothetical protein
MTSLQLGLIAAGVVLVIGVVIYNWLQERRVRKRIHEAFRDTGPSNARSSPRVEPTLARSANSAALPENPPLDAEAADDAPYEPPLDIQTRIASELSSEPEAAGIKPAAAERTAGEPDPDIECIVTMQPVRPVSAGAIASGMHARIGKPLRWFGRRNRESPWQRLRSDTPGEFAEIVGCLLLADRGGAASVQLIDAFARLAGSVAASIPAA